VPEKQKSFFLSAHTFRVILGKLEKAPGAL